MKLELITPPLSLPISLESVKEFLRVIDNDQDSTIESMIKVAIKHAENITNRQLGGIATFVLYVDSWEDVRLPKSPTISIEKVEYRDSDEQLLELDSDMYLLDRHATPAVVHFFDEMDISSKPNPISITFTAGYETLPVEVEQYIKAQVATMYEHREKFVVGASIAEFGSKYIDNLLDSLRIIPI